MGGGSLGGLTIALGWQGLALFKPLPRQPEQLCRRRKKGCLHELAGRGWQVRSGEQQPHVEPVRLQETSTKYRHPVEKRGGQKTELCLEHCGDLHGKQNNFLNQNILLLLNKPSLIQPHLKDGCSAPPPLLATPASASVPYRCQQPFHPGEIPRI